MSILLLSHTHLSSTVLPLSRPVPSVSVKLNLPVLTLLTRCSIFKMTPRIPPLGKHLKRLLIATVKYTHRFSQFCYTFDLIFLGLHFQWIPQIPVSLLSQNTFSQDSGVALVPTHRTTPLLLKYPYFLQGCHFLANSSTCPPTWDSLISFALPLFFTSLNHHSVINMPLSSIFPLSLIATFNTLYSPFYINIKWIIPFQR